MAIHITSTTKSCIVKPSTKDELKTIIEQELERQGPDADLNFIDVSEIDNMECLFYRKNIRYIEIDGWDVSNVTDMHGMFYDCKYFNCDLSLWNTSNVQFTEVHEVHYVRDVLWLF
jgi:surface protein